MVFAPTINRNAKIVNAVRAVFFIDSYFLRRFLK
jgi:hypothetical protein